MVPNSKRPKGESPKAGAPEKDSEIEVSPEMIAALRAAYDADCLEQQLDDWDPRPSSNRVVELFIKFYGANKRC
jgi:hypothetical protein